jgi:hypothetical protein
MYPLAAWGPASAVITVDIAKITAAIVFIRLLLMKIFSLIYARHIQARLTRDRHGVLAVIAK